MTVQEHHDIEGIFHLHDASGSPVDPGSELYLNIDGEPFPVKHIYPDMANLLPGQAARISLAHPDTAIRSLGVGSEVDVFGDTHQVGTLRVTKVLSPALGHPPSRMRDILMLSVFYLLVAVPTIYLGTAAYTPCVTNFEGGCSMAKGMAALISLLPAACAVVLGIVLMQQLSRSPVIAQKAPGAPVVASLLWLAPAAYVLCTLYLLF